MIVLDPICFCISFQFNRTLKLADGSTEPKRPITMLKKIKGEALTTCLR